MKSLCSLFAVLAVLFFANLRAHAQFGCEADISGDGQVNGVDLAMVLSSWGTCTVGASIDGVFPSRGPVYGGTPIAIVGVDLGATASVTIDGVLVPKFNIVSSRTVTAVTPSGTVGPKALVLRNGQGQQIAAASFLYAVTSLPWATVIEQEPDPAVVTSPALRAELAATGLPWRVRDNGTGIEMLLVPPGTFDMGCIQGSNSFGCFSWEQPVHTVTLTNAFYLGRYEVTQAQWTAKMGFNPSFFQGASAEVPATQVPNRPVEEVSWNTIQGFLTATGLRLPTEAEWEYAYRAGTTTAFHGWSGQPAGTNDDSLMGNIAWYSSNSSSQTRPVGGKAANGLGLHDMTGNVWEWVNDWYGGYSSAAQTNPPGPSSGTSRVFRGGSWIQETGSARSSYRLAYTPSYADSDFGFRVARNP
jgi:formylglycine-generating enzyme required for sulfatase activity